eukprot:g391.t1
MRDPRAALEFNSCMVRVSLPVGGLSACLLLLAAVTLPARLTASTTSLLRTGNPASNVLPDEGVPFSAVKLASALAKDWEELEQATPILSDLPSEPASSTLNSALISQEPSSLSSASLPRFRARTDTTARGYPTALAPGSLGKEQEDALMESWRGSIPAPTSSDSGACFGLPTELCDRCPAPMQIIAGADMEIDWVAEVDNLPPAVREKYFPLSKMEEYKAAGKTDKRLRLEFKCDQMKEQCRQNFCKPICLDTMFDCSIADIKVDGFIEVSSQYKDSDDPNGNVVLSTIAPALCRQFKAKMCSESKCCKPIVDKKDYSASNFKLQAWLDDAALGGGDAYTGRANVATGISHEAGEPRTLPSSGGAMDNSFDDRGSGVGFGGLFGGTGMLLPYCNRYDPSGIQEEGGELATKGKDRCDECKKALKDKITFRTMAARLKKEQLPLGRGMQTCRGLRSWVRDSGTVEGSADSKEWNEYINYGGGPYKITSMETMCDRLSMKFSDKPEKPPLSDDVLVGTACSCMGCCRTQEAKTGDTACPWPVLEDQLISGQLTEKEAEETSNRRKERSAANDKKVEGFKDKTAIKTSVVAEGLDEGSTYVRTPQLPSWGVSSELSEFDNDLGGNEKN